ncbi:MAG: RsmD family RNA methyltransferase [Flavobacteriales bacterium]
MRKIYTDIRNPTKVITRKLSSFILIAMRITSGKLKGRLFSVPTDLRIRPTTDQAKEALFSILNHRICFQDVRILDLFCGIGSISYEFASRGVPKINCVDIDHRCIKYVQETIQKFQITQQIQVVRSNVFAFLAINFVTPYDLIFADPPYRMLYKHLDLLVKLALQPQWVKPKGLMVLEHSSQQNTFCNHSYYKETRQYGQVCFSFFEYLP